MVEAVPSVDSPRIRRVIAGESAGRGPAGSAAAGSFKEPRARHDRQGGETGGQKIRRVVKPGGRRAEVPVPVIPVTDHRIHRVDTLVNPSARRAEQEQIEERRDHAVGGVFRHRLNRCLRDAFRGQGGGIPPHHHRNCPSRRFRIALCKRTADVLRGPSQRGHRQHLPCDDDVEQKRKRRAGQTEKKAERKIGRRRDRENQNRQQSAGRSLPPAVRLRFAAQPENPEQQRLETADQPAEADHRMPEFPGISQDQIQRRPAGENQRSCVQIRHHVPPSLLSLMSVRIRLFLSQTAK